MAFFDYDRTLCAHFYPSWYKPANYYEQVMFQLKNAHEIYKHDKPVTAMKKLVEQCYDNDVKMFCITHEIFNLRDDMKQKFLNSEYGDYHITYLTTNSAEHKIDMMRAYCDYFSIETRDVLFVDDNTGSLNLANIAGFRAYSISSVCADYEDFLLNNLDEPFRRYLE